MITLSIKKDKLHITTLSIKKNKLRWLFYYLPDAYEHGIKKHPQEQLKELGIECFAVEPMMIADGWHLLTDYQGEIPEYILDKTDALTPHDDLWLHCGIDLEE